MMDITIQIYLTMFILLGSFLIGFILLIIADSIRYVFTGHAKYFR